MEDQLPAPTTPTTKAVNTAKKVRPLSRGRHVDVEPVREVHVYNSAREAIDVKFRNSADERKKCISYQTDRDMRQESRRRLTEGLQKQAHKIKTVTNDDVVVAVRSAEKKTMLWWTTAKDFAFSNQSPVETSTAVSSTPSNLPSFVELARASPSKSSPVNRPHKMTAREMLKDREKFCRKCGTKYDSYQDKSLNSTWIGCDGRTAGKLCDYWVHACCHGFPDAGYEVFDEIDFKCPEHNTVLAMMKRMVANKEQSSKKRRASTKKKAAAKKKK